MKRIILSSLIATTLMFGAVTRESSTNEITTPSDNVFDLSKLSDEATKNYLSALMSSIPNITLIIHDYYGAKHCDDDYYLKSNFKTIENEVKIFVKTSQHDLLVGVLYSNPSAYKAIINNYKYMNCGIGKYSVDSASMK